MTAQQPALCKVLKLDRWVIYIKLHALTSVGAFLLPQTRGKVSYRPAASFFMRTYEIRGVFHFISIDILRRGQN